MTGASARAVTAPRLVLIVAGQSNATGLGSYAVDPTTGVDYLTKPYATKADHEDTITWLQSGLVVDEKPEVSLDTPQMRAIIGNKEGKQIFGPEIGLARTVTAETGEPLTIIKVTYPGTLLGGEWDPGDSLWKKMVKFVDATIATDAARGVTDHVGGFYWVQGEADSVCPICAEYYQYHLTEFVQALRSDAIVPTASPIVLGKTWMSKNPKGSDEVRAADDYVAAHEPNVYEVDTKDLPRPLGLHISNVGELALGKDMAKVAVP